MATDKRTLKKEIRMICGSLAGECVITKITVPEVDPKALNDIIYDIADLQTNALRLVNISYPRTGSSFATRKEYMDDRHKYFKAAFAKLKSDFNARVEAIIKAMNAALPASQKEANRKVASRK